MGRPRKDDELELEKRLEERRKFLEKKYKEDLELVEKCFYEENQYNSYKFLFHFHKLTYLP